MPSFLHQPSYEDFPVRLSQGLWQHSSRWEPTDFHYFSEERQSYQNHILAYPKIYRHKRRTSPSLDAYWVLKDDETGPALGWAELQSFPGKHFSKGFLFIQLEGIEPVRAQEALTALASLAFTLSRNDYLRIITVTPQRGILDRVARMTGTVETLMSLPPHAWHPSSGGLHTTFCLAVDRSSWRNCRELQESMRTLKHIEMRLNRLDRAENAPPKKKKRPFLVRLFKPKIDDSLF